MSEDNSIDLEYIHKATDIILKLGNWNYILQYCCTTEESKRGCIFGMLLLVKVIFDDIDRQA